MKLKEESENVALKFNIQKTKIVASGSITSWQIEREPVETVRYFILGGCRWWFKPCNLKTFTSWKKNYDQHTQHIKKQKHYFANKRLSSQGYGFPSSHVCMWALHYKES